jgi:hypothetical protein
VKTCGSCATVRPNKESSECTSAVPGVAHLRPEAGASMSVEATGQLRTGRSRRRISRSAPWWRRTHIDFLNGERWAADGRLSLRCRGMQPLICALRSLSWAASDRTSVRSVATAPFRVQRQPLGSPSRSSRIDHNRQQHRRRNHMIHERIKRAVIQLMFTLLP